MATNLALRSAEFWFFRYRRVWRGTVVSSLLSPIMFLAAMGIGLGTLVNRQDPAGLEGLTYVQFLAPGLLAATAMQTAVFESTWPVMGAVRWTKTYHAMLATPLGVVDLFAGHLLFVTFRLVTTLAAFLAVSAAFGAVRSPWALLALPAAVLTGLAFATPVFAFSVTRENESGFASLYRFGIVPMFLFSGAFFPIEQLPAPAQWIAYLTPVWHGVDLCRDLMLGMPGAGAAALHVAYLAAWTVAGALLARPAYARRLRV